MFIISYECIIYKNKMHVNKVALYLNNDILRQVNTQLLAIKKPQFNEAFIIL